ncbi:MAG: sigma-70 family RNA polymerase sigma factor [Acidobacteriaceae bacterium]|nr:sigma-70 family RNA polymerase sigma factor [Acidobacteriaceae bacterium]
MKDSRLQQEMQNHAVQEETDDVLVEKCRQGDQRAFGELMRRYQPPALKVALSIMRDREDAEDEVQNAFSKAYEHINQFNRAAKFSTWLTRIVVNQCLMHLRKTRRARFTYIDDTLPNEDQMTMELPDRGLSPEQVLGQVQVGDVLHAEIRRTPPLLRTVFLLRDVEQRPMSEVANILGISVAAAKSRLLRSRAELRNRMRQHYGEVGPATLMNS